MATRRQLNLPDELILMLLNEQTGYFYQVPGWSLNCAVIGAALADLSLQSRIDTDINSLVVLDSTETGDPVLDLCLKAISKDKTPHNARYWIERLAVHAEDIIDSTLDRLVKLEILKHHEGEFWTLAPAMWHANLHGYSHEHTASQFIKSRISDAIFSDTIPFPRDIIIIGLVHSCGLFHFMFEIDEKAEKRIEQICQMELIGRSIAAAVKESIAVPLLQRPSFKKKIPSVPLFKILSNKHLWNGNMPAMIAEFAKEYGSVFRFNPPLLQPLTFLAGIDINRWVHRNGRLYLTSRKFYQGVENEYGGIGVLTSLDGSDHFTLRRALQRVYSVKKLESEMNTVFEMIRKHMKSHWKVGSHVQVYETSRSLSNAQIMPLLTSTESNDIFEDVMKWKNAIQMLHVLFNPPKFVTRLFLNSSRMKRGREAVDIAVKRVQQNHTPEQRVGQPWELADETLQLYASDPQFFPEANIKFMLSSPMLASQYFSDLMGCAIYAMVTQPELYERIRSEADAIFSNGDPDPDNLDLSDFDVTHRFVLECQRIYPVVYLIPRHVSNSWLVDDIELPVGEQVFIVKGATHFMEEAFPDPFKFDIDRYLPPTNAHRSTSFAPVGLGTHTCLGIRWVVKHMAINLLMIAHYFRLELSDPNFKFKFNAYASLSVSKKLKIYIAEQLKDFPA